MDLQNIKNVFPLNLLGQHFDKYFITSTADVSSTKVSPWWVRSTGTRAATG